MDGRRTVSSSRFVSRLVFCCCAVSAAVQVQGIVGGRDARGAAAAAVRRSDQPQLLCPDDACSTALRCPAEHDPACPLGLVPDGCACCPYGVCGQGEAAECNAADRPCANNLECVQTENGGDITTEFRCVCKNKELTCGSDNKTYSNACQLNEAASKLGSSLWMQYWGPCQSAPIIRSVPKNFAGSIGQPVVFDCEVKGYPVPSISWRFTDTYGITKWLPGDDTLVAIQTRGGPDRFTVSSWVQIMEFKPNHTGNYTCLGTNSVDAATASAVLDVRKIT